MELKTKQLKPGMMVKNVIDGKFYPLEKVERSGAGYVFTMTPARINGNQGYCEYNDRFTVAE